MVSKTIKTPSFNSCENCTCRIDNAFGKLNNAEVELINTHKICRHYHKGEQIFREGTRAIGLFCISNGKVKIYKTGDEGRDQIVRLAGRGDIIGYRAVVSNEPYFASAMALEDTTVCMVPLADFNQFMTENADFVRAIIQKLSQDLRHAEERLLRLAQKSVRERMADTLLLLMDTYGTHGADCLLNIELSREDIAAMVGTATETAIRLISDFRAEGILVTHAKKIGIRNEKALRAIAG